MSKKERIFALVAGQSGTGKSFFVKNYAIKQLVKHKPVIIFDVLNEYGKLGLSFPGFREFLKHVAKSGISKKIYVISWKSDEDIIAGIKFFRKLEAPVSLVFEEMHSLFTDANLRRETEKALKEITFYGRHYEIDCILITQRPKSLPTNLRSQIEFCVSFRQTLTADIEALKEINPGFSEIAELENYYYYAEGNKPATFAALKTSKPDILKK